MSNSRLITKLCDALIQFIPRDLRYDQGDWLGISGELTEYLTAHDPKSGAGSGPENAVVPPALKQTNLRYVLYGAWWSRWRTSELEKEKISRISQNTRNVCLEVIKKPETHDLPSDVHGAYARTSANQEV
jgi:hypothetical protein